MNLLAIETATEACSVALLRGDVLHERSELAPRRHAELVLPMAEAVLAEAGVARAQLHGIAFGRGPGAFTGVRLAVSVAQGLALALDLPVLPVSSLAALALEAPADAAAILAVIDARMGEVYAGTFLRADDGMLQALGGESVGAAATLALPAAAAWSVVGSGWGAYGDALAARLPSPPRWAEADRYPQARHVARLAAPRLAAGQGLPAEQALPVYLRDKVALTLAEQQRA
ncbi:MAG: tRNA (adenosine(37)-N6)-threonylcarbamoyltransferase complex dimerization subunit type 1 TsaB [Mizugakiibacter sp.]|uniref:tRNA (adenosine(37)-N6)-threonylcarbamoyltransferase complex dimerization subunit type 1 TsaB n=1 Tax=Mizugakiibacter sp. TaxID=1972610 RepID=UPI0031BE62D9|nr:tRNA (adenosine(37)-N6)-threonylcarbamoyltransferase complex dimerization subunit type 1 TsaB [Xanthomonadaceae bacterium]